MSSKNNRLSDQARQNLMKTLSNKETSHICQAIVDATHVVSDYEWLVEQLLELTKHSDIEVRRVAVTCIGHLARLHRARDKKLLLEILEPLQYQSDIAGRVSDAIDDVNMF